MIVEIAAVLVLGYLAFELLIYFGDAIAVWGGELLRIAAGLGIIGALAFLLT